MANQSVYWDYLFYKNLDYNNRDVIDWYRREEAADRFNNGEVVLIPPNGCQHRTRSGIVFTDEDTLASVGVDVWKTNLTTRACLLLLKASVDRDSPFGMLACRVVDDLYGQLSCRMHKLPWLQVVHHVVQFRYSQLCGRYQIYGQLGTLLNVLKDSMLDYIVY